MSDPNTIIYADAFGEDALLDEGLPLAERRQALVALHRLLHGASVDDAVAGLEPPEVIVLEDGWSYPEGGHFVATIPSRPRVEEESIQGEGASPEESLARALAFWISRLTLVIAERRIARAIELGHLAGAVMFADKGVKAAGGSLKGLTP